MHHESISLDDSIFDVIIQHCASKQLKLTPKHIKIRLSNMTWLPWDKSNWNSHLRTSTSDDCQYTTWLPWDAINSALQMWLSQYSLWLQTAETHTFTHHSQLTQLWLEPYEMQLIHGQFFICRTLDVTIQHPLCPQTTETRTFSQARIKRLSIRTNSISQLSIMTKLKLRIFVFILMLIQERKATAYNLQNIQLFWFRSIAAPRLEWNLCLLNSSKAHTSKVTTCIILYFFLLSHTPFQTMS